MSKNLKNIEDKDFEVGTVIKYWFTTEFPGYEQYGSAQLAKFEDSDEVYWAVSGIETPALNIKELLADDDADFAVITNDNVVHTSSEYLV